MDEYTFPEGTKELKKYTITGIYFLIYNEKVVYVGKALNILSRIHSHIIEGKKIFNKVKYLECEKELLETREYLMIKRFAPKYNINHNGYRNIRKRNKEKISIENNDNISIKEYIRIKNLD